MLYSYEYQNVKRDLSDMVSRQIKLQPVFLSLIRIGAAATAPKHEWLEDELKPTQDATAGTLTNVATSLTVVTGTAFEVGDIWVNVETDERFKVTAVSTNTLTITRAVGGTATAMSSGDVLKLVARPKLQGSAPEDATSQQPGNEYNHTQIFADTARVTNTAQNTNTYGIEDQLDYQVSVVVDRLLRQMNMTAIYGARQAAANGVPGMMGGLLSFIEQAGANKVDAAAAALTKTMLNDALEMAFNDGAGDLAIVCGPTQARKITALDANYQIVRTDTTAGHTIMAYQGDIAGAQQASKIIVDPNYPKKRVDFVDLSRLALVPLQNRAMHDLDATPSGVDYVARRVIGEYTFEVKNAKDAFASVTNLAA